MARPGMATRTEAYPAQARARGVKVVLPEPVPPVTTMMPPDRAEAAAATRSSNLALAGKSSGMRLRTQSGSQEKPFMVLAVRWGSERQEGWGLRAL